MEKVREVLKVAVRQHVIIEKTKDGFNASFNEEDVADTLRKAQDIITG